MLGTAGTDLANHSATTTRKVCAMQVAEAFGIAGPAAAASFPEIDSNGNGGLSRDGLRAAIEGGTLPAK